MRAVLQDAGKGKCVSVDPRDALDRGMARGEGTGDALGDTEGEQLDSVVSVIELFKLPLPLKE